MLAAQLVPAELSPSARREQVAAILARAVRRRIERLRRAETSAEYLSSPLPTSKKTPLSEVRAKAI